MDKWFKNYAKIKVRSPPIMPTKGISTTTSSRISAKFRWKNSLLWNYRRSAKNYSTVEESTESRASGQPRGLSPKTVRNICQVIASAMKPAKEKKIIATDPTEGCALPKLEHREMKTLPVEQLTSFLQEAKESGVFEMYYAELAARLRKGELLGLKWEEIDLDRGGLWVKRHGARINGEVAASLKTKNANQTLPPAEDTIQVLKQQRKKTSAVPGCFPHPPAVYLTGQRPAYTPPGAETGGSASGQVPRFTAYIRTAGPPERGRYQDDIRDAGALQRGVHPAYLCPRHHSGPEGGG